MVQRNLSKFDARLFSDIYLYRLGLKQEREIQDFHDTFVNIIEQNPIVVLRLLFLGGGRGGAGNMCMFSRVIQIHSVGVYYCNVSCIAL